MRCVTPWSRKRADDDLRHSEARYRSLVESLPLHMFRKDLEGRLVYANQTYLNEIGLPWNQLEGKTDYDLFPRHLAEKYRRDDARVISSRRVFEDVEEHRQPHGETIYVQVLKSPVYDAHGNVVGIQGMFWDVSARQRAEEALRASDARFRSLTRSNVMGILMVHQDGPISEANDAFLDLGRLFAGGVSRGPPPLGQAHRPGIWPGSTGRGSSSSSPRALRRPGKRS